VRFKSANGNVSNAQNLGEGLVEIFMIMPRTQLHDGKCHEKPSGKFKKIPHDILFVSFAVRCVCVRGPEEKGLNQCCGTNCVL